MKREKSEKKQNKNYVSDVIFMNICGDGAILWMFYVRECQ